MALDVSSVTPAPAPTSGELVAPPDAPGAQDAMARARDHLLGLQAPAGWWKGELETNVTMDAEDLLLRHVLGILDRPTAEAAAGWIRRCQR